jgi:hypothetical protein
MTIRDILSPQGSCYLFFGIGRIVKLCNNTISLFRNGNFYVACIKNELPTGKGIYLKLSVIENACCCSKSKKQFS